jgi:eukaryotic-like serine/threonine-protein kinase
MAQVLGNRYQLLEQLGEGAMGIVYKAQDRLTGAVLAIKQLRINNETEQALALAQEFRTLASLHHPHIIGVLDYGFTAGQPFFTMNFVEGAKTIVDYALACDEDGKLALLIHFLQALTYLHRRGIVHRDLKPGNVLVNADGQVKVLDFGLAIEVETGQHDISGTVMYMAPEILQGHKASAASDLYAVGTMMIEIFTGSPRFQTDSISEILQEILYQDDIELNQNIDKRLEPIILRLIARDPLDRYQSTEDLITALCTAFGIALPSESRIIQDSFLQGASFVGRDAELNKLFGALAAAQVSQGGSWLIAGESGVGKSRLLDELRIRALVDGVLLLSGQGVEGGGLPFQLWRDVLRHLILHLELSDIEAGIIKPLVRDIEGLLNRPIADLAELEGYAQQQRIVLTIVALLRRYFESPQAKPMLLILEDLHWTTESLEPFKQLSHFVQDLPLLIVASYRDDERPQLADEFPRSHVIKLERFSHEAIKKLSYAMIGAAGNRHEILELLERETEGNVFFLIEVVRTLAEKSGSLAEIGRITLPHNVFPKGIQELIVQRINRIPAEYHRFVQFAAILGRQLDESLMQRLIAETDIPLDDWLLSCGQAAILELQGGAWRFVHDKIREGVLLVIPTAEASELYRIAAEALEAHYPSDMAYAPILIRLWNKASNPQKELSYLLIEGDHLNDLTLFGMYHEAHKLYQRALELQTYASPEQQLDMTIGMAVALIGTHAYKESSEWFQRAIAQAEVLSDYSKQAWALSGLARCLLHLGENDAVLKVLDEAVYCAKKSANEMRLGEILVTNGYIYANFNDFASALDCFLEAITIFRKQDYQRGLSTTLNNIGKLNQLKGDYESAKLYLSESRALALSIKHFNTAVLSTSNLGIVAYFTGEYAEALAYFSQSIHLMKEQVDNAGLSHVWILTLFAQADMGSPEDAYASLQQAILERVQANEAYSNIYLFIGGIRLTLDQNPTKAAEWLGLLYAKVGDSPFILEWLNPLKEKLARQFSPDVLQILMEQGRQLDFEAELKAVEAL